MADLPDLGVPYRFEPAGDGDDPTSRLTMLLLHEVGGDENSLVDTARRVAPAAAVLSPRGALEAEGGGYRHLPPPPVEEEGTVHDPDLPTPHEQAIHDRTPELAAFLTAATEALGFDGDNVCVLGFSEGATAATALFFDHPALIRAAIILSGREPFRAPRGRILDKKQIFCATGRNDESVTIDDYEELVEGIVTAGADVELHWYDAGHEICDQELEHAATWVGKHLAS
jgi:phospholipase/carboxylesterase